MFIAKKTDFGSNLNPKLDLISAAQAVNSSQDLSSLTLFKVYLNLLWLFVWSSQCLKKCFCLAQASGSLKLHRLKVVSFHGGAVVCEKDQ